jgi:AhpD family alkylhydroperoxidase
MGRTDMANTYPDARLQLTDHAPHQFLAMRKLEATIDLDPTLADLVKIRASQINGCAFCLDMHWKDARAGGESEERLYMLEAWREAEIYSASEQAALDLCEAMTLIHTGHVPDDVWDRARAAFDDAELGQLVFAITAINAWNRLKITVRSEAGHYQPAAREAA